MSRASRIAYTAAVAACIGVALWLRWPALAIGFHGDDSVQLSMLRGDFPVERHIFDLFRFADVERDGKALMNFGYQPWWTQSNLRIAMFRPLSSALIALDHELFGLNAVHFHIHSLVWWVALLSVAAIFLRSLFPAPIAATALALFAIDESQGAPVAWIANRSTLLAMTFGVLAVWAHVKRRTRPSKRLLYAETIFASLALLAGEYALAVLSYVVAYELVTAKGPRRERLRATLPIAAPAVVYLALRSLLGFGIRGSGFYVSPTEDPVLFLRTALDRLPALFGDLIGAIPASWWLTGSPWVPKLDEWRNWQGFLGLVCIAVFVLVARWLARRLPPERAGHLRFLALGTLLSVLPGAGALPEGRLVVAASLGFSAVLAVLIAEAWRARQLVVPLALAAGALYLHVGRAGERSYWQLRSLRYGAAAQRKWAVTADIPNEHVRAFPITGADFTTNANLPFVRAIHGYPVPRSYRRLSGTIHVHEIVRKAENEIELAILSNDIGMTMAGSLHRSVTNPLRPGDVVELEGMRVEVLRVAGPNPWRMRFTFDRPVDDPSYVFLHSMADGLKQIAMPPVGGKFRLPRPHGPHL